MMSDTPAVSEGADDPMEKPVDAEFRTRLLAASASVVVGIVVLGAKFYVYRITGSSAFLSDALESIINVVASVFALGSILLAAKPPDASHPYGHGKIEYFSVGFEGALIFGAAIGIFIEAWPQIFHPRLLPNLGNGLLIACGISSVNLALAAALIITGKRTRSITLIADGKHVLTDVFTSMGVVIGLFLVWLTGWIWMDGVVACLVAVNILWTGWRLISHSFAGLMDASDPDLLEEITRILKQHRKRDWIDVHQLRARRYGNQVHMDFHLVLPRDLTLDEGHEEVKKLERIFKTHYGAQAEVIIHLDPCRQSECPVCGYDPCRSRRETTREQRLWRQESITGSPDRGARAQASADEEKGD